ncbi:glycosyl hydrolase family 8 [Oenococcus alcoholitolerans]|uniref:Glucanase n=1 Tax=Oenococcus alcoholitolerans TaxID=931074 RepID=A0ABR4XSI1_9LACO|nr:hypothetical protein Q757_01010 [Oenococcus alcoholitolerans]
MFKHVIQHFWVLIVVVLYLVLLLYIRVSHNNALPGNFYHNWRTHYLKTRGHTMFVKTNVSGPLTTLSESQGYAMQITLAAADRGLANQQDFQKLVAYYQNNQLPNTHLMSWRQRYLSGHVQRSHNSATDGDVFIADSLIQAARIWPSHQQYYLHLAHQLLQDILTYEYNPGQRILTVGNWADKHTPYYTMMRTSDVLPESFDRFYQLTADRTWLHIKNSMLNKLFLLSRSNKNGLIPDFAWIDSNKKIVIRKGKKFDQFSQKTYGYNACRIPMNLAKSRDKKSRFVLHRLLTFFDRERYISAGYSLNGHQLNTYQSPSFSAPVLYASAQFNRYASLSHREEYVLMMPSLKNRYYDETLTTMTALSLKR